MKTTPIIFNAAMVRAILSGQKTQTRQVIKRQDIDPADVGSNSLGCVMLLDGTGINCPYGKSANFGFTEEDQRGDRLWIRETWARDDEDGALMYRADVGQGGNADNWEHNRLLGEPRYLWKSPIHMPRWASRISLEITDLRVEKLQDISENDAQAEGAPLDCPIGSIPAYQKAPYSYCFAQIWESINGSGSWAENPWVWVIEFKRIGEIES